MNRLESFNYLCRMSGPACMLAQRTTFLVVLLLSGCKRDTGTQLTLESEAHSRWEKACREKRVEPKAGVKSVLLEVWCVDDEDCGGILHIIVNGASERKIVLPESGPIPRMRKVSVDAVEADNRLDAWLQTRHLGTRTASLEFQVIKGNYFRISCGNRLLIEQSEVAPRIY